MSDLFRRILIANRGEIACRVIRTARRLGISTVAVYSQADAAARHVRLADEAVAIGPAPARQSYLRMDAILQAARLTGAEAIHPGYGFLSENPEFAEACAAAGIMFIGPPPAAMRAMGSKAEAKALMEAAGVPLVPGYHGEDQSAEVLARHAARIGYPVLLKASAGGGGKGMRVVERPEALAEAIERARGEARASFGEDRLLVEKYLTRPRHIEVQLFADTHGNCVSLFERDCSIQRRHQKVLEESPAPFITGEQRQQLGDAAIAAARAVGYVGAGTVEFIYEDARFYFMEMNTRLQVEHPVTEFVTGLDLVEWQIRVAAGEPLPLPAEGLRLDGHAIEARICAEQPEADFRPSTGRIVHLREPSAGPHVRIDAGVEQGDSITPFYDSMIAKLIVWDRDRPSAVRRLRAALAAYEIVGPHTNLDLLRGIVADPDYAAGDLDTGFISRHPGVLAAPGPVPLHAWAAAALAGLAPAGRVIAGDPHSPWSAAAGFRLNGPATAQLLLGPDGSEPCVVEAVGMGEEWCLHLPGGEVTARLAGDILHVDGRSIPLGLVRGTGTVVVVLHGRNFAFRIADPTVPPPAREAGEERLVAPTPARVVGIFVSAGDTVAKGDRLLILESMKVETTFTAPRAGEIEAVLVSPDELVPEGARLVRFVPE